MFAFCERAIANSEEIEGEFVQYKEVAQLFHNQKNSVRWECALWPTSDETDRTVSG